MKRYSFNRSAWLPFLIVSLLLQFSGNAYAQQEEKPPYHVKVQFAGGIGLVSAGVGRSFFSDRLETDLFLGYLPEKVGGDRIVTAAIKLTYVPVKALQVGKLDWQPIRTGLQVGYTFGQEYFAFEPRDKYPKSYYGFSTATHLYFLVGGQVNFDRVEKLKKFGLYYELGSSAEYIISYMQNPRYLGPGKIFNLSLGVRMKL